MKVARAYGMIHPGAADTSAVRATFVIDPEGILRAMVYYPMTNGRSIPEFLRLVTALQTSDANKIATPEGWQPGDKVIVPPPADMADGRGAHERRLRVHRLVLLQEGAVAPNRSDRRSESNGAPPPLSTRPGQTRPRAVRQRRKEHRVAPGRRRDAGLRRPRTRGESAPVVACSAGSLGLGTIVAPGPRLPGTRGREHGALAGAGRLGLDHH